MVVSKFRRASRNGVKLRCILRHTYDLHIGLRYLREHACCWFRDIKRPNFIGRPWRHHQRLPVQFINDWPNQKRNNSWNLLRQNNRKLDHGCSSASRQLFWDQEFYTVTCTKPLAAQNPSDCFITAMQRRIFADHKCQKLFWRLSVQPKGFDRNCCHRNQSQITNQNYMDTTMS